MPSTAYTPQTDHRDIGLGVAIFKHPYRTTHDHRIYHDYTHLPILGYCPGCSSKAHMNQELTQSTAVAIPDLATSAATSTSETLDLTDNDLPDYPEDGVLVTAESQHCGPSYTFDNQIIGGREDYRVKMVKYMLDRWANAAKLKKQREASERKMQSRPGTQDHLYCGTLV